jgi:hypothetical protein
MQVNRLQHSAAAAMLRTFTPASAVTWSGYASHRSFAAAASKQEGSKLQRIRLQHNSYRQSFHTSLQCMPATWSGVGMLPSTAWLQDSTARKQQTGATQLLLHMAVWQQ